MGKFIVITFLLLGAAFYEMSGGSDFVPQERPLASIRQAAEQAPEPTQVSRNAANLITLNPQVTSVSLDTTPITVTPIETAPVTETVTTAAVSEPVVPEVAAPNVDLRAVAGNRVNMRQGPGTNFGVLDTLPRGTEAEVIEVNADGWARIRVLNTDQVGWMAERLLSDG